MFLHVFIVETLPGSVGLDLITQTKRLAMGVLAVAVAGAVAYSMYTAYTTGGPSLKINNNITTDMLVRSIFESQTQCFQDVDSTQSIRVEDTPGYQTGGQGCARCLEIMRELVRRRLNLEQEAANISLLYIPQEPSSELLGLLDPTAAGGANPVSQPAGGSASPSLSAVSACDLVCRSLVVVGVSQDVVVEAKANCQVENDVTTSVNQSLSTIIESFMKNQQDIFGQITGSLTPTQSSISTDISSVMSQNLTQRFVQSLINRIVTLQQVNIGGPGRKTNSVYVENIRQSLRGSQVGTLNAVVTVNNEMTQSAAYNLVQSIVNKNDTTGDLVKSLLGVITAVTDMVENLSTAVIMVITVIVLLGAIVYSARYVLNSDTRNAVRIYLTGRV